MRKHIIFMMAIVAVSTIAFAQRDTLILHPAVTHGIDEADVYSTQGADGGNLNLDNPQSIVVGAWMHEGRPVVSRGFVVFDYSALPYGATIERAILHLHTRPDGPGNSTQEGSNSAYVDVAGEVWNAQTVNWQNQPATMAELTGDASYRAYLEGNTTMGMNAMYTSLQTDVTALVGYQVAHRDENYGFRLALQTEQASRRLYLASGEFSQPELRPTLEIVIALPPLEATHLSPVHCGITNVGGDDVLDIEPRLKAIGYEVKVSNEQDGDVATVIASVNQLVLAEVGQMLEANTLYKIGVRAFEDGYEGVFGEECRIQTASVERTALSLSENTIDLTSNGDFISADPVAGATGYEFQIIGMDNGTNEIVYSRSGHLSVRDLENIMEADKNYEVYVRAIVRNLLGSFGNPGYVSTSTTTNSIPAPTSTTNVAQNVTTIPQDRNWVHTVVYGENGAESEQLQFLDEIGRPTQGQAVGFEDEKVFNHQVMFDVFGRAALQTLPAPIGDNNTYTNAFAYKEDFVPADLLGGNVNPAVFGSLAQYYSETSPEPLIAESNYPYSQVAYYHDPLGRVHKSSGIGEDYALGSGHEAELYYMSAGNELNYLFGLHRDNELVNNEYTGEVIPKLNTLFTAHKTVSVDAEGLETIAYTNGSGELVAKCVSGLGDSRFSGHRMRSIKGFDRRRTPHVDVHLPQANVQDLEVIVPSASVGLFDLYDIRYGELLQPLIDYKVTTTQLTHQVIFLNRTAESRFIRVVFTPTDAVTTSTIYISQYLDYSRWTLHYYDGAGRLAQVVPPEGISHSYNPYAAETIHYNVPFDPITHLDIDSNKPTNDTLREWNGSFLVAARFDDFDLNGSHGGQRPGQGDQLLTEYEIPYAREDEYFAHTDYRSAAFIDPFDTQDTLPDVDSVLAQVAQKFNKDFDDEGLGFTGFNYWVKSRLKCSDGAGNTWYSDPFMLQGAGTVILVRSLILGDPNLGYSFTVREIHYTAINKRIAVSTYEMGFLPTEATIEFVAPMEFKFNGYAHEIEQILNSDNPYGVVGATLHWIPAFEPAHKMKDQYTYNGIGELLRRTHPDKGTSRYVHDVEGKIRFTQDARQKTDDNVFTFVRYDEADRVVETGQYRSSAAEAQGAPPVNFNYLVNPNDAPPLAQPWTGDPALKPWERNDYRNAISNVQPLFRDGSTEWTRMHYDLPAAYAQGFAHAADYPQDYTIGRLSKVENEYAATWYSYDDRARVQHEVQYMKSLDFNPQAAQRFKTLNYTYDRTNNITDIAYQYYATDDERIVHHYAYDRDAAIVDATVDIGANVTGEQVAHFEYYLHGALKRMELGDQLQGLDYVYTIDGRLKAINHPQLNNVQLDPGRDDGTTVEKDVFGMSLNYFINDYRKKTSPLDEAFVDPNGEVVDRFNGSIKSAHWNIRHTDAYGIDGHQLINPEFTGEHWMTGYVYDKLGQMRASYMAINTDGERGRNRIDDYIVRNITYDDNGNIQTLQRNGHRYAGAQSLLMDDLRYSYAANTNQLTQLADAVNERNGQGEPLYGSHELNTAQHGETLSYYGDGMMKANQVEGVTNITYYHTGKMKTVTYVDGSAAEYEYDAGGSKLHVKHRGAGGTLNKETWYIAGSIYEREVMNGEAMPVLEQHILSAGGRVGMWDVADAKAMYEISDHQGNVRAVVSRDANDALEVVSWSDYYPFGAVMPGRNYSSEHYRYGYQGQEKDEQTGWNTFQLRSYNGLVARWYNPDPMEQYHSPYLAMGNSPINGTDPSGGQFFTYSARLEAATGYAMNYTTDGNYQHTVDNFIEYDMWEQNASPDAAHRNNLSFMTSTARYEAFEALERILEKSGESAYGAFYTDENGNRQSGVVTSTGDGGFSIKNTETKTVTEAIYNTYRSEPDYVDKKVRNTTFIPLDWENDYYLQDIFQNELEPIDFNNSTNNQIISQVFKAYLYYRASGENNYMLSDIFRFDEGQALINQSITGNLNPNGSEFDLTLTFNNVGVNDQFNAQFGARFNGRQHNTIDNTTNNGATWTSTQGSSINLGGTSGTQIVRFRAYLQYVSFEARRYVNTRKDLKMLDYNNNTGGNPKKR